MVFNIEGYCEEHIAILSKKKLTLEFRIGVNLPPNIEITRMFQYNTKRSELVYQVCVGKNKNELSRIVFSKAVNNEDLNR